MDDSDASAGWQSVGAEGAEGAWAGALRADRRDSAGNGRPPAARHI